MHCPARWGTGGGATCAAVPLARAPYRERPRIGEEPGFIEGEERCELTQLLEGGTPRQLEGGLLRQLEGSLVPELDQDTAPLPKPPEEHQPARIAPAGDRRRHLALEKSDARLRLGIHQVPRAAAQNVECAWVLQRGPHPFGLLTLLRAAIDVGPAKKFGCSESMPAIVYAAAGTSLSPIERAQTHSCARARIRTQGGGRCVARAQRAFAAATNTGARMPSLEANTADSAGSLTLATAAARALCQQSLYFLWRGRGPPLPPSL